MGLVNDHRDQNNQDAEGAKATPVVTLNEDQLEAANHVYGPAFVSACPGSGKTRVIVERAARLIEQGISPKKLLCITFTNKAAGEMKERLSTRLGPQAKDVYISTFHALAANILRKYGRNIGYIDGISIIDSDEQESVMSQCARQMDFDLKRSEIKGICWQLNSVRESLYKSDREFDEGFTSSYAPNIAREYMDRLKKANQVDFSGMLTETIRLLESDKETLQRLQDRFELIQVDEAQDTNLSQFRIVDLLGIHNNVMVVGDMDQSIYGWRGARYENITDFIKSTNAKVIELPLNYRSTPEIVTAAERLIRFNEGRQSVEFKTVNDSGHNIENWILDDSDQEGYWIGQKIEELMDDEGWKPEQFAILYRANAQSRAIEIGLAQRGIPYHLIGSRGFYDLTEIKDCLAMLRFLMNPQDGTALSRFINKPARAIGEVTIGRIENSARDQNISVLKALSDISNLKVAKKSAVQKSCQTIHDAFSRDFSQSDLGETLEFLMKELDYDSYLENKHLEKLADKRNNVKELLKSLTKYSLENGNDVQSYMNSISLMTTSDKESKEGSVTLMTMHASKGLEFPVVIIPSLEEGILPHSRSIAEQSLEEERRLCYVAMTRAEKRLITSRCKNKLVRRGKFLNKIKSHPSRFLFESGILEEQNEY